MRACLARERLGSLLQIVPEVGLDVNFALCFVRLGDGVAALARKVDGIDARLLGRLAADGFAAPTL